MRDQDASPSEHSALVVPSGEDGEVISAVREAVDDPTVDWLATGKCFIFPAVGGLLFGYDIGATSGVLVSLTNPELSGTDWYDLNAFQSGLVVSLSLLGALLGSLTTLGLGNKLGRRTELMGAAGLYGLSSVVVSLAPNLGTLLGGRLLYGLGIGFAMHAAPAYIAETSPPNVRGLLISLKEALIVGGILLGYLLSYLYIDVEGGWRSMYGAALPLSVVLGVGMWTLPESPRWLLLNGVKRSDALQALVRACGRRARNSSLMEAEVDTIRASLATAEESVSITTLFSESRYSRPLLVGMSLMLFQQITGQPSVLYYATKIFQDVGFKGGQEATEISVVLGAFKLAMTLLAVVTVDKWGRRPLLLGGVGGIVVALLVLSASQSSALAASGLLLSDGTPSSLLPWVSLVALLLYVGCYQASFGPISWLIVGEVFPLVVRSQALALATFVNFGSNFLVSLVLPSVQETLGLGYTYMSFATIGVVALLSIYMFVPETKGKTLEEIEESFRGKHDE